MDRAASLRLIEPSDAERLADLLTADREILAWWETAREDHFFNADGQLAVIAELLGQHAIVARDRFFTAGRWHDELLWERMLETDSSGQEAR